MGELRLTRANEALNRGDYALAIELYVTFLRETPDLRDLLEFNLSLARQRYRASRRDEPLRVAVCGWDLSHNAAGRVKALADIYAEFTSVQIIGAVLPQWRGQLWAPLRGGAMPCHILEVTDEADFPRQALDFVLAHPFDVVHLSKPRFPNILFGLLYKLVWGARVLVDVDDEELGSVKADTTLPLADLPRTPGGQPRLRGLAGKMWTQIAVGLSGIFDHVTVSNPALQEQYGGTVVPHARAAPALDPVSDHRRTNRARLGMPIDKTVVLFFGTARRHKGLMRIAKALAALGRDDICLAVVGDCPDAALKEELQEVQGLEVIMAGIQPYDDIADVALTGDICILLQDDESLLAQFQSPAKLTDALAAGMLVLAQRTPALAGVIDAGAALEVTPETLKQTLDQCLNDPARAVAVKEAGRRLFHETMSIERCADTLSALVGQPVAPSPLTVQSVAHPEQMALFEALGKWELLRSSGTLPHGLPFAPDPQNRRLIVYSVLVGDYERVKEPEAVDPAARYILFTDRPDLTSRTWEVVQLDTLGLSARHASRLPKLLAHRYLQDHDISIYLDASLTLRAPDIAAMARDCLQGKDFAAYSHFKRDCVYDEIEECVRLGKIPNPQKAAAFGKALKREDFPRHYGLFENAFLVRRNTEAVRQLNETWYRLFDDGVERDQVYLMYALWTHGLPVSRIANSGNFRKSPWLRFEKHDASRDGVPPALPVPVPNNGTQLLSGPVPAPPRPAAQTCAPAPLSVAPRGVALPSINWVMNADNVGWAYGNNATTLSANIPGFAHLIDAESALSDIAMYFDIKLFLMHGVRGRGNILRVGGPRPVALSYGEDYEKLREDIAVFDGIIVLNSALYRLFATLHPNVMLIPNALDLDVWRAPLPLAQRRAGQPFTVGFSGNLKTSKERRIKGFDIATAACERLGVPLLHFGKGEGQIPRDEMQERFYGRIDCLLHPVLPGKEGCSNVIMEALALGVPVITTHDAGFHAERIADGDGILYCQRDEGDILRKLTRLRDDPDLRTRMSDMARGFAEAQHDIRKTAPRYRKMFEGALRRDTGTKVNFVPFWEPVANFASSRLRCAQPAKLLADNSQIEAGLGLDAQADVLIVSQLASDETCRFLFDNPHIQMIYDVCDRYFDDDRMVGGVPAKTRFFELAARANVIVASTIELKRQISALGLGKAVVYLPDGIDYSEHRDTTATVPGGPVLWYGNAGRNNFESARWMIDHILNHTPHKMRIISRKRHFQHVAKTSDPSYAPYADLCKDWAYDSFVQDMRDCSVCIISHSPEERAKSPNRLITAVANGVPVIVSGAPSCEALLRAADMGYAAVSNSGELDSALARLSDPSERARYLDAMQAVVEDQFGDAAIRNRYETLLRSYLPPRTGAPTSASTRVLFLSHNLNIGEGAPTSLMQTVSGLTGAGLVDPLLFAAAPGALQDSYERNGVPVFVADYGVRSRIATKVMARTRAQMTDDLRKAIRERRIQVVVANTATTLWMIDVAHEMGVPGIAVIRESSTEHVSFDFGPADLMDLCRSGLRHAAATIFVSGHTRDLWQSHHDLNNVSVIPNGIDLSHFDSVRSLDKSVLRRELDLPVDRQILISVGSINARKSQLDIVEALAALPAPLREGLHLALVGAKPSAYLEALKERVRALGLQENVTIAPETDVIARWYRAADIFVFASRNESYPRVVVEAMSFGLPVISSMVFGTQEQIVEGESGLLFPPGDVATMTQAIHWLTTRDAARERFGERAERRFWELVTYWEMVQQYHAQIERTLLAQPVNRET